MLGWRWERNVNEGEWLGGETLEIGRALPVVGTCWERAVRSGLTLLRTNQLGKLWF